MPKAIDHAGARFGRLVVLRTAPSRVVGGKVRTYWICQCDCGSAIEVMTQSLIGGNTVSCGCQKALTGGPRTHLMSKTRTYAAWRAAKQRCGNPSHKNFHNYGGRGITMCQEWRDSFEAFYAHMGDSPPGLELDRINNNGNYEPGNCRWATRQEQIANQRWHGKRAAVG